MNKETLKEIIIKNKPKLSSNSLNTYTSILYNIHKKYSNSDNDDIKWFNEENDIINHLKDINPNIRKTIYSALISLVDDKHKKKYKDEMMKDAESYNIENSKQEKTKTQQDNWISQEDIKKKFDEMLKDIKGLWKKDKINNADFKKIQDVIIIALTSGVMGLPPRRAIDWCDFVIHGDIDEKKDNYLNLKTKELIFNTYKGSNQKGTQKILCPNELLKLLKKWISINTNKYLLVDSSKNKMNSVKLNQHLERIWGKKSGVNIMRHSFISAKYPIFNVDELKKDAEKMGSSANMMLETYIKKN